MAHYIILGNFTEQGIKNVRQVPKRDEEARRMIEQAGGKMQIYYTLGEYDFVAITEMPDDEAMMKFRLQTGSLGNVRTKTLKAWTEFDSAKVISQV
jgi:uncharacterized protein with GYD domain